MGKRLMIIALLLAAAFAGGDEIKWTKSKELKPFPITTTYSDVTITPEKARDKYTISWSPATRINAVEFIDITYLSWEFYCAAAKDAVKNGKTEAARAGKDAESIRGQLEGEVIIKAAISVNDRSAVDLLNPYKWTSTAVINGLQIEGQISNANLIIFPAPKFHNNSISISYPVTTVLFVFTLPPGANPQTGTKIVPRNGDFAHGFEWRFQQL